MSTAKKSTAAKQTTTTVSKKENAPKKVNAVKPTERIRKVLDEKILNKTYHGYRRLLETHPLDKVDAVRPSCYGQKELTEKQRKEVEAYDKIVNDRYEQLLAMEPMHEPEIEVIDESSSSEEKPKQKEEKPKVVFSDVETDVLKLLKKNMQVHFSSKACALLSSFVDVVVEDLLRIGFDNTIKSGKKTCSLDLLFSDVHEYKSILYTKKIESSLVSILENLTTYKGVRSDLVNLTRTQGLYHDIMKLSHTFQKVTMGSVSKKVAAFPEKLENLMDFGPYNFEVQTDEERLESELDVVPEKRLNIKNTLTFSFFVNGKIKQICEGRQEYQDLKKSKPFKNFIASIVAELIEEFGSKIRFALAVSNIKTINDTTVRKIFSLLLERVEGSQEYLANIDKRYNEVYKKKEKEQSQ